MLQISLNKFRAFSVSVCGWVGGGGGEVWEGGVVGGGGVRIVTSYPDTTSVYRYQSRR